MAIRFQTYWMTMVVLFFCFPGSQRLAAFSLLGPYDDWMTRELSYGLPGQIGAPQQLGEEYRWNLPVVTYGFDDEFLDFFGTQGIAVVEQAIAQLNALPRSEDIVIEAQPLNTLLVNAQARDLKLFDLKSAALSALLEEVGLTAAIPNVFTLRQRTADTSVTNYLIINRNFAPLVSATANNTTASHAVNDVTYTWEIGEFSSPRRADTVEVLAGEPGGITAANPPVAGQMFAEGEYATGLTRDDVAGLIYLLRPKNLNMERLLPGVESATPGIVMTNAALRPGVSRIEFRRYPGIYDPAEAMPMTVAFDDVFQSQPGVLQTQAVTRTITRPDILFSAHVPASGQPFPYVNRTGVDNWINNAELSGSILNGPGQIVPGITVSFSKSGGPVSSRESLTAKTPRWGAYDGPGNDFLVFPNGHEFSAYSVVNLLYYYSSSVSSATVTVMAVPKQKFSLQFSTNLVDWADYLIEPTAVFSSYFLPQAGDVSQGFWRVIPMVE